MEYDPELESFNPREIQILTLIADGLSNREIAQRLHLSPETVKWYNKQIFAKLGAASRTQAVSTAKRRRLLIEDSPEPAVPPPTASRAETAAAGSRPPRAGGAVALLDQLVRGQMVGRQGELQQLEELWAHSQQGHLRLALVSGEPGIGKTRLAGELIAHALAGGAAVLRGGCYEYEAATPYLPFMEAFREWVHLQPRDAILALMGDTASSLARLAPEIESKLGPLPPNPPLPPGEERMRLFDHVTRFLQGLAGGHGLLVWIDDLHWADQGTLALLSYLLRNLHNERVLILAAYREIELDRAHPLAAALVEWTRERVATRISLTRLTFAETTALLETLFGQQASSDELPRAVYVETEGNPFFIEEVVKTLIEQGQVYRKKDRWERMAISEITIPQSIKEAIGRRLNRLSPACLDSLHAAAVLGKEFEFAELAAVSSLEEDVLLDAMDEAGAAQLIKARDSAAFSFTHDKIREVLYEEINPIRRKRLHQRIGEVLEDRYQRGDPGVIPDLAHHFTQSGDLSRSLSYALLAAENASQLFALDDALGYYEIAHEAAESLRQSDQLAAIHRAIGEIHSQRGQVELSVHYFQRALDLESDPEARGALKARMGSVYTSAGDARALPLIEAALQELNPQTQADEVALATAMIGRYYHYQCFHWKAIEYLQRARLIAEPLGNPETLNQIYAYLAGAYQHMTQFAESMAWAERNIALGRQKYGLMAEAFGNEFLAEDSAALGNWSDALRYSGRDLEIGRQTGAQNRVAWASYCLAIIKHGMGDLASAEQDARSAHELAENMGDFRLIAISGGLLVQILADLGRQEQVDELGEQALRDADDLKQPYIQALIRHYYAYALLQQDQPARALALYLQAEELIRPTENRWAALAYSPWQAQALFDLGRVDESTGVVEKSLQLARDAGARYVTGQALRVAAQLALARGEADRALQAIQDSGTILRETGTRLELGRSILVRGIIRRSLADPHAASADWREALDLFESLGALGASQKARKLLEQIGGS